MQPHLSFVFMFFCLGTSSTDDDTPFTNLLKAAEAAIEKGVVPERINQGSSGSYFVKNAEDVSLCLIVSNAQTFDFLGGKD